MIFWSQLQIVECNPTQFHSDQIRPNLLRERFPKSINIATNGDNGWPPRSQDLSTPDFFQWGYLKERVYNSTSTNRVL